MRKKQALREEGSRGKWRMGLRGRDVETMRPLSCRVLTKTDENIDDTKKRRKEGGRTYRGGENGVEEGKGKTNTKEWGDEGGRGRKK